MNMNRTRSFCIWLGCVAVVLLQACKDDDREIGDPWNHIEGLTANEWILTDVDIIDEGNPSRPRRSLSQFFVEGNNILSLKFEPDGSFTSVPGDGGQVFPLSGTWSFDRDEAPRFINIVEGNGNLVANLGSPVRIIDPQLRLELVKKSCIVDGEVRPALGYRFTFNRKP